MARVSVNGYARTHFGVREVEDVLPSVYEGTHGTEVLEVVFSYDDLPVASTDNANLTIPANAHIVTARLQVLTAFADGTSYDIGLEQDDGTVIDADGLFPAADVLLADLAAGNMIEGSGALIVTEDGAPVASIGANAGQIVVSENGTFTAGKAKITVEYVRADDRA